MNNGNTLNARQERYCQEYVADPRRNQTRAAIRAGYPEKSARMQASRLMTNDNIKRRIKELYQEALEEAGYSIEEMKLLIMRKLTGIVLTDTADIARVVYADDERRKAALAQLADANGGQGVIDFGAPMVYIRPTAEWTPDERAAVKSIAMDKYGIRVETYDKTTALKTLAEITGIVRSGVDVNLSIADGIEEARQRAAGTGEAGAE